MMDQARDLLSRVRAKLNTGAGQAATVALALAILAGAALWFLRDTGKAQTQAIRDRGRAVLFYCNACGRAAETRVSWDEKYPLVCPQCGKKQAAAAFKCARCKEIMELKNDLVYYCPRCHFMYDNRLIMGEPP